jgi:hypothetical protein
MLDRMDVPKQSGAEAQQRLAERWVTSLAQLPAVEVIWLEGSLVDDRANPWSDIDLRIAIADDAYELLWQDNRAAVMEGLGEHRFLFSQLVSSRLGHAD